MTGAFSFDICSFYCKFLLLYIGASWTFAGVFANGLTLACGGGPLAYGGGPLDFGACRDTALAFAGAFALPRLLFGSGSPPMWFVLSDK